VWNLLLMCAELKLLILTEDSNQKHIPANKGIIKQVMDIPQH